MMKLYEYFCTDCDVYTYTDWEAPKGGTEPPFCCNCGNSNTTELTGKTIEVNEQ